MSQFGFPPGSDRLKQDSPPLISLRDLRAAITHNLMPGSDSEDDGVAPEQQHEDDDEDLRGGQIWLLDPSLAQRWENCGLVGHFQD